jgi:hypothetical protein
MGRIRRRIVFSGALLMLSLGARCAHGARATPSARAGSAVDARSVARSIVLCTTTEADLRRQLGEPARDGILHGARVVSWITRWNSPSRYLAVLVSERGVVTDIYWDIPTEVPWVPTDQCQGR